MSSDARVGVVSVGRLYCDLVFTDLPRMPSLGTEIFAGGLGVYPGGGAFITAAYLVATGRRALLASHVPAAPFGTAIAARIDAAGVDRRLCLPTPPGVDPQVTVAMVEGGDRAFLSRRAGPAAPTMSSRSLAGLGVGHLHIAELSTLVQAPDLLKAARAAGLTISLDCGWDEAVPMQQAIELIRKVDVFLPNAPEAAWLASKGVAAPFCPLTVIKCGSEGATARTAAGDDVHMPAQEATVVDTTGAGDAFNAGFLDAWLAGQGIETCLAAGNRLGARAIGHRGGFQPEPLAAPAEVSGA